MGGEMFDLIFLEFVLVWVVVVGVGFGYLLGFNNIFVLGVVVFIRFVFGGFFF